MMDDRSLRSLEEHTPGPWLDWDTLEWLKEPKHLLANTADARLIAAAPDLLEVVKSFVVETVDYMTINRLGDPEKQHNVRWAREVIAKAEGRSSSNSKVDTDGK